MAHESPHIILDAHQDIAYNYFEAGRDFRQPALKKRQHDNSPEILKSRGLATIGLPDALQGRVGIVFATLYSTPGWSRFPAKIRYNSPREAHEQAMRQLDYYRRLVDSDDRVVLIQTQSDLQMVLASWAEGCDEAEHRLGLVILMEGADPILEPPQAEEWFAKGVRIIGPAWSETRYAGGTGRPGPLTDLGHELLEVMASNGMILDLSHLAEKAYYQAIERYEGPMIASHSNPRHFLDSDRMLSDKMIALLAERDGVMGLVPYNGFMTPDWRPGDPKNHVTIEHYLDMIDYVCQLTGSARHVGIGSDWDGGFGSESIPHPFDTVADLWKLNDALLNRGFQVTDVQAVLSGNFLRLLQQGLPSS